MNDRIFHELSVIEQEKDIEILFACESGSRAWGFESPNSDYDIRFIYRHPVDWYLSVSKNKKDSIMKMVEVDGEAGPLDFSGWDIKKALHLMGKSNPQLIEWLQSPIIYKFNDVMEFFNAYNLIKKFYSPKATAYHYYHMARGNYREYLKKEKVRLKKYLYVVRPLLANCYVQDCEGFPPVNIEELMAYFRGDTEDFNELVLKEIDALLIKKRSGNEMGMSDQIPALNEWIEVCLKNLNPDGFQETPKEEKDSEYTLDQAFRSIIKP